MKLKKSENFFENRWEMLQKNLSRFLMLKNFLEEEKKEREKWHKSTFDKSGTFFD